MICSDSPTGKKRNEALGPQGQISFIKMNLRQPEGAQPACHMPLSYPSPQAKGCPVPPQGMGTHLHPAVYTTLGPLSLTPNT